jgi:hypothetical protein
MKKTLTTYEIADALLADKYANWTRPGALALANHLEEIEEGSGQEIELDVVAIRCDFSEWQDLAEWADEYFGTLENAISELGVSASDLHEDVGAEAIRTYIEDRGDLLELIDGGIIVSYF